MNNKLLLPLLIVLVLSVLGVWKWSGAGSGPSSAAALGLEGALEGPGASLDADQLPGFASQQESTQRSLSSSLDREQMAAVAANDKRSEPSNAIWISGHIVFPGRMPLDTGAVEVTARGRGFGESTRREHTVRADRVGDFRVAFARETKRGWLSVRGRYLYSPEKTALDLRALPPEVLLEPELGGVLSGVVSAPLGLQWTEAAREGALVMIQSWQRGGNVSRRSDIDADGRFELSAVPAGKYNVQVQVPLWANKNSPRVAVRAGENSEVNFQLLVGSMISGRVLDAQEVGRGGAAIELSGRDADNSRIHETTRTLDDGSFELLGISEGTLTIKTSVNEALQVEQELGFVKGGTRRDDLILHLSSGDSIQGVVRWPDGSPVSGAFVQVTQEHKATGMTFNFSDGISKKTLPDGTFEISGLEPTECVVRASGKSFRKQDIEKARAREKAGKKLRKLHARGPTYAVRREHVAPGSSGLVLVLDEGDTISGRVLDDQGDGLKRFMVSADPVDGSQSAGQQAVNRLVISGDGHFTVDGLREGTWMVRVAADDHEPTQRISVEVPATGELEFIAKRLCQVSGVVRDGGGEPVSGASIWIRRLNPSEPFIEREISGTWGEIATTNHNGEFTARDVQPGRLRVWSKADGFGSSLALEVFVDPGAESQSVALRLDAAGRIRGALHSSIGDRAERRIAISAESRGSFRDSVTTNSRGEFEVQGLDQGSYRMTLRPSSNSVLPEAERKDVALVVEVGAGDTVTVVLGGPPANPTLVTGVVSTAGGPVVGVVVRCRATHDGQLNNDVTRTGEDGTYQLTLNGGGEYSFEVGDSKRAVTRFQRDLVDGTNSGVDFLLPSGAIRGEVHGMDGQALASCVVTLKTIKLTDAKQESQPLRTLRTDEAGSFEFDHVAGGTYHLRINDEQLPNWRRRTETQMGTQIVEGLEVAENSVREGLVFNLEEEGRVSGEVTTPDGQPAAGAWVWVYTPSGVRLGAKSMALCDSSGRFTCNGIGLKRVLLGATMNGKSGPRRALQVSAGQTSELSLEVPAGGGQ